MSDKEQREYLSHRSDEMKNIVFEIGKWPMYKVHMIRTAEDHVHVLYAFDAVSYTHLDVYKRQIYGFP